MRKSILRYLKDKVIPVYQPTKLGKAITDSLLEYPDDWVIGTHTAKHIQSEIELWLANEIKDREISRVPDMDREALNKHLSYGDRVAIDEIVKRLRKRHPEPEQPPKADPVDPVVALLSKRSPQKTGKKK
jgi:hypothetical protein